MSVCLSVLPHGTILVWLDAFLWNFIFEYFSEICREGSNFVKNLTIITSTLCEDISTFIIISRWILLRMGNISDKSCRENQNMHFMSHDVFSPRKSCRSWDNVEKYGRDGQSTYDDIIRRMRFWSWNLRMQTHTQNMQYLLLFLDNSGYAKGRNVTLWVHCLCCLVWNVLPIQMYWSCTKGCYCRNCMQRSHDRW